VDRRRFLFGSLACAVVAGCESESPPGIAPKPANLPPPPGELPGGTTPPGRSSRINTGDNASPKLRGD
jgi:hypothetical protein